MFESLCCAREWTLRPGSLLRRSLVCLIGVILTAIGITVALKGHAGVDPFTALLQGVSHITGLSFSWVVPVVNIALIALIFPFDHKVLGLGTVLNFTLVGVLVTSFTSTLDSIYVFTYSIPGMLAHLAIGLVIFALGLSLYITPDIGQGAADCIVPVLLRRFPSHSYRTFRVAQDFIVVLIALVLFRFDLSSGVIGIGTAIMALGIGVVVDFFNRTVAYRLVGTTASYTARPAPAITDIEAEAQA
ncbi:MULTISPECIES: YczE/YyaS/YitT family protein [Actinotignum]|uniref:YitT family protein n=1 Tax=Actinotignum timonense TaxID=1870995 RepID=A0AAW9HCE6_9ACTO|nr:MULTISPECIES: YitT family protein [Actinotignum]MBS5748425.1 YitT family protein [Actinotignum schaalii]MDE1558592.1 YitT family protein [Actinotignum schaalii]MDE1663448.1 YitT family protein [Actinotignum schaalii]MDK6372756.1 YitT family protein [Actinotignum timonense]MDK6419648.1 YitT family protein [Actinotignum timonense]